MKLAQNRASAQVDAEIGDHRQAKPAADCSAVNRGDDRLFGAEQPVAFDIKMCRAWPRPAEKCAAVAVVIAEIGAGAKCFSLRGQHQRAALGVGVERLESGGDLLDQRDVEEVIWRSPDLDQGNMAAFLHADIVEGTHALFLRLPLLGHAATFRERRHHA